MTHLFPFLEGALHPEKTEVRYVTGVGVNVCVSQHCLSPVSVCVCSLREAIKEEETSVLGVLACRREGTWS